MSNDWMTPKDYFLLIVEPTVEEYRSDRSSHHKVNAISRLSDFSERYFKYHKENGKNGMIFGAGTGKEFGQKIFDQCPAYGLLWDSANGVKHHFPDAQTPSDTLVNTSTGTLTNEKYNVGGRSMTIDDAIETTYSFWKERLK